MQSMKASELVSVYGNQLVGCKVSTPAMGAYPGGIAVVTEVILDDSAMDIVFFVQHPTWRDDEGELSPMGIFDYEDVQLITKPKKGA